MKKSFKWFLILPIVCLLACVGLVTPKGAFKIIQSVDFEAFSSALDEFEANNPYDDFAVMSFDKSDLNAIDGDYLIEVEEFATKTGNVIETVQSEMVVLKSFDSTLKFKKNFKANTAVESSASEECYISLKETAQRLGYEVDESAEKIQVINKYGARRLLVYSDYVLDRQGAVKWVEGYKDWHVYQYQSLEDMQRAYNYYSSLSYVKSVEIDEVVTLPDDRVSPQGALQTITGASCWGTSAVGAPEYCEYLTNTIGENKLPEVIVAVIDTGIDSDHPLFAGRLLATKNCTTDGNEDVNGHGTHVAGTIVDLTLSNVKILPIKVMGDDGTGFSFDIIEGIEYAITLKQSGRNIVAMNMSLGGFGIRYASQISTALDNNIITVAAAGNEACELQYVAPANVEKAITVGAVMQTTLIDPSLKNQYLLSPFSNYGTGIDVVAPGQYITSAYPGGLTQVLDGTSMAAPHVAGLVALLASDSTKNYTCSQIENMLKTHALDLGETGYDELYGYGMPNLKHHSAERISNVVFSNTTENHTTNFTLTMSCAKSTAKIYYTTDGSMPSETNGTLYTGAITISKTQQVQAVAYVLSGGKVTAYSQISSQKYIFNGQDVDSPYLCYSTNDGKVALGYYKGLLSEVTIPSTVYGKTIDYIWYNAFVSSDVRKVTLPESVTTIYDDAFAGCKKLEEVYCPGVTTVYWEGFYGCVKLTELSDKNFPKLQTVDVHAFAQCPKLKEIYLPHVTTVFEEAFSLVGITEQEEYIDIYLPNVVSLTDATTAQYFKGAFYERLINFVALGKNLTISSDENWSLDYYAYIYGYSGSTAQTYATRYGYQFFPIDDFKLTSNLSSSKTAEQYQTTTLSVGASGLRLQYQWYKVGTSGDEAIVGATSDTLTVDTSRVGSAKYYAIVTNWDLSTLKSNTCQVTVNSTATYTLTASCSAGGSISNSGTKSVEKNSDFTYTFAPNAGYYISSIQIDGQDLTGTSFDTAKQSGSYTFTNITANHSIYVEFTINKYVINSVAGIGGSISPCGYVEVQYNASQTFTITPNHGYHIKKVMVDGSDVGALSSYTFDNVTEGHSISTTFEKNTYTITASAGTGGSISPSGVTSLAFGESQTYSFTPNTGYQISAVWVDDENKGAISTYTISNIEANHTIRVEFTKQTFTVVASASVGGVISNVGNNTVEYGADIHFSITPNVGWHISHLMVDGVRKSGAGSYIFQNVQENHTIHAVFEGQQFVITSSAIGGGSITPNGSVNVGYGLNQTYIFTPNEGHCVKNVVVDSRSIGVCESYTFDNVTSIHTITVEFEKIKYQLVVTCGANGNISPSGTFEVEYGSDKIFNIVANEGYKIYYIQLNGRKLSACETVMLTDINQNYTLHAEFVKVFTISASEPENGKITSTCDVEAGATQRFEFYPDEGYRVKDVKIDGFSIGAVDCYVFEDVQASHTISVEFEIKHFVVLVEILGEGAVQADNLQNVAYNESRTLTFVASEGWVLKNIYIDGVSVVARNQQITLKNIKDNKTVKVEFIKPIVVDDKNDNTTLAIVGGGVLAGIFLMIVLIATLVGKGKKTKLGGDYVASKAKTTKHKAENHALDTKVSHEEALVEEKVKEKRATPAVKTDVNSVSSDINNQPASTRPKSPFFNFRPPIDKNDGQK